MNYAANGPGLKLSYVNLTHLSFFVWNERTKTVVPAIVGGGCRKDLENQLSYRLFEAKRWEQSKPLRAHNPI